MAGDFGLKLVLVIRYAGRGPLSFHVNQNHVCSRARFHRHFAARQCQCLPSQTPTKSAKEGRRLGVVGTSVTRLCPGSGSATTSGVCVCVCV
jgi:hypothetical protein